MYEGALCIDVCTQFGQTLLVGVEICDDSVLAGVKHSVSFDTLQGYILIQFQEVSDIACCTVDTCELQCVQVYKNIQGKIMQFVFYEGLSKLKNVVLE